MIFYPVNRNEIFIGGFFSDIFFIGRFRRFGRTFCVFRFCGGEALRRGDAQKHQQCKKDRRELFIYVHLTSPFGRYIYHTTYNGTSPLFSL